MNKYKVGTDGRTACERITGHKCRHFVLGFAETVDYILETEKGKQFKADSRVGVGVFIGYVWRTTEYLVGTKDWIFRCRTIRRRAEEICDDASFFDFLKVSYDECIMAGTKTKLHVTAPVGIEQSDIPTRGRDFFPRGLYMRPTDYARFGYTQGCRGCTWQQNKVGPRPGHTEACRARLETEIAKVEDDDRMQTVQDRPDHFAATKVSEGDEARVDDPRQQKSEEPKPQRDEGAGDDAPPAAPSAPQELNLLRHRE